jgi:hypothetical protein
MIDINHLRPVRLHTVNKLPSNCTCISQNGTFYRTTKTTITVNFIFILKIKISHFSLIIGLYEKSSLCI